MFVPPNYNEDHLKNIMIAHGMGEAKVGRDVFFQQGCPVNACTITRDHPEKADLILFKDYITHYGSTRRNSQVRLVVEACTYAYIIRIRKNYELQTGLSAAGVDAVLVGVSLSHAGHQERIGQLDGNLSS